MVIGCIENWVHKYYVAKNGVKRKDFTMAFKNCGRTCSLHASTTERQWVFSINHADIGVPWVQKLMTHEAET